MVRCNGRAKVAFEPGNQFIYSGASYTLLQLLIEEVSGPSFDEFINKEVFIPLQIQHSSFPLADSHAINLVSFY